MDIDSWMCLTNTELLVLICAPPVKWNAGRKDHALEEISERFSDRCGREDIESSAIQSKQRRLYSNFIYVGVLAL